MSGKYEFRTCPECGRRLADANKGDRCYKHSNVSSPLFGSDEARIFPGALCSEALGAPHPVHVSKLH